MNLLTFHDRIRDLFGSRMGIKYSTSISESLCHLGSGITEGWYETRARKTSVIEGLIEIMMPEGPTLYWNDVKDFLP